jgi:hypothetical protein
MRHGRSFLLQGCQSVGSESDPSGDNLGTKQLMKSREWKMFLKRIETTKKKEHGTRRHKAKKSSGKHKKSSNRKGSFFNKDGSGRT